MKEGEIDYLVTVAGLQTKPWDQSNWVAVKLPSEANPNYLLVCGVKVVKWSEIL